jgi:hypothetical protein
VTSSSRLDPARPPAGRVRRAPRPRAEDFRTPVRGHVFAARPPDALAPTAGHPARLVRELDNPRDPLAVAVWSATGPPWRLGYLDRAVAARLAPRLDAGERLQVELAGWIEAPGSAWQRPLLRVVVDEAGGRHEAAAAPSGLWGRPPGVTRRVLSSGR